MLTFDEGTHTYRWNGRTVPGVTSVLAPISGYDKVPRNVLELASQRGKAVHMACQLDDEGALDEAELDPVLVPYLAAWRAFSADHGVAWTSIEKAGYHPTLGYAGTPDRVGKVVGRSSVVDIKTTYELMPPVGPQLAAYAHLTDANLGQGLQRLGVQLRADGSYHVQKYTDPMDWPLFASLLTLRNWCAINKVSPSFKA